MELRKAFINKQGRYWYLHYGVIINNRFIGLSCPFYSVNWNECIIYFNDRLKGE